MFAIYFATTILGTALLIQTQEVPQFVSLKTAKLGDNVTLHCGLSKEAPFLLYWYKQSLGFLPQVVISKVYEQITNYPPFNSLRFTVSNGTEFYLHIRNINKEDEANYFCNQGEQYKNIWKAGTFLSIKDPNHQMFVIQTVVQQPESVSVQLGDPVALQCSIISQRTDHRNQCQGEPSVYWFRSGSGPSHPAAIYVNGNRSGECQDSSGSPTAPKSCVYTLPKNNVNISDAGTYYCALAACGEVVFGHGTKVDITEPYRHLVTMVLGILLACCLGVIMILVLTRNKKQVCQHCKGTLGASDHMEPASEIQEPQDSETDALNYSALEFSGRKSRAKNGERPLYSESQYSAVTETL